MRLSETDRYALFEEIYAEAKEAFYRVWIAGPASQANLKLQHADQIALYKQLKTETLRQLELYGFKPARVWLSFKDVMPRHATLTKEQHDGLVERVMLELIERFDSELVRQRDELGLPELCLYAKHPDLTGIVAERKHEHGMGRTAPGTKIFGDQRTEYGQESVEIQQEVSQEMVELARASMAAERQKRETIEGFKSLIKDDAPLHKRVFKKLFT